MNTLNRLPEVKRLAEQLGMATDYEFIGDGIRFIYTLRDNSEIYRSYKKNTAIAIEEEIERLRRFLRLLTEI